MTEVEHLGRRGMKWSIVGCGMDGERRLLPSPAAIASIIVITKTRCQHVMVRAFCVWLNHVTFIVEEWLLLNVTDCTFKGNRFGTSGYRKFVVDVQIFAKTYDENAFTILWYTVVYGIDQLPFYIVASPIKPFEKHDEH